MNLNNTIFCINCEEIFDRKEFSICPKCNSSHCHNISKFLQSILPKNNNSEDINMEYQENRGN